MVEMPSKYVSENVSVTAQLRPPERDKMRKNTNAEKQMRSKTHSRLIENIKSY